MNIRERVRRSVRPVSDDGIRRNFYLSAGIWIAALSLQTAAHVKIRS